MKRLRPAILRRALNGRHSHPLHVLFGVAMEHAARLTDSSRRS